MVYRFKAETEKDKVKIIDKELVGTKDSFTYIAKYAFAPIMTLLMVLALTFMFKKAN